MKTAQTDFSKGSVYRNIIEVALPMMAAQILNLLYNIIDRIYIGRIPNTGSLALTGVGLCFPIIIAITAFASLYGSGGSPLCAIERGKGNTDEAEKIIGTTFLLLLLTGIFLSILCIGFNRPLLYLFGASEMTIGYASDYIVIYLLGSVFVMLTLGLNPFINGQGFGGVGMLTVLIGAIINIILDPIFIFVLQMGVRGAAIATVISQFISCCWALRFLTGKSSLLKLRRQNISLQLNRVQRIVSLGLTGFVVGITNSLVHIVCNTTLQLYGGDIYVGVMTVLSSVREIFTIPISGLTSAASPVMSFNYGAKAFSRVRNALKFMTLLCVGYTLLAWLLVYVFPDPFIRIFNEDPELIRLGKPALRVYFFGFFMMAFQFVGQTTFISLGKAKNAVFFSLFRKVVIVVPLTVILPRLFGLGVYGVFYAEPISNFIGGAACFITMLRIVLPEMQSNKELT